MNGISSFVTRAMYYSRWVMIVFYGGLVVSLVMFGLAYLKKLYKLTSYSGGMETGDLILSMLSMIDMTLIAGLMVMVLISGYDSYIAKFNTISGAEGLKDITHVGAGAIKLKISTAIIVISSIYILEMAMDFPKFNTNEISWTLVMHGVLLGTGLILALIEKITAHH